MQWPHMRNVIIKHMHIVNQNARNAIEHIVELCRNKNIMKLVFCLKEKSYKYELMKNVLFYWGCTVK